MSAAGAARIVAVAARGAGAAFAGAALAGAAPAPASTPVAADPRWNGTWREVPARSHLFVPGIVRVSRPSVVAYRIVVDGEAEGCGHRATDDLACAWPSRDLFEAIRRSPGPPPATTRWRFALAAGTLVVTTRIATPRGPAAVDWHRYCKSGHPGLTGMWRKVADGETPTVYRLALTKARMHVATADGLLDFRSPLLDRAPTSRDKRGQDHVYGAVTPSRLIELSFRGTRLVGRSDLLLAPDGTSFVERHIDSQGRAVSVYFVRDESR